MVNLQPSTATRQIIIEPAVGTSLSISSPSSVPPGELFNISGILTRDDTGAPVPYASIPLKYNGTNLGSATTGVDGDYLKTVSIGAEGTFTLEASFAGGSGYSAATATRSMTVGAGMIERIRAWWSNLSAAQKLMVLVSMGVLVGGGYKLSSGK